MKRLPLPLKLACTAYIAVLIPVYWTSYGFANFFSFCDIALFMALAGLWLEHALLLSMALVATLIVDAWWIADMLRGLLGLGSSPLTAYMFTAERPLGVRLLSLFHVGSPPILLYALHRVRYDARALVGWTGIAIVTMAISYLWLPPPSPDAGLRKVNVNYVYGFWSDRAQDLLPPLQWMAAEFAVLFMLCWLPAHLIGRRFLGRGPEGAMGSAASAPAA